MILPRISIERPVLASMMSLMLLLFGLISLDRLPVREVPDIDPPVVSVTTIYTGANASVIETEVTERLEEAVNNIEGIRTLRSESREQVSTITIEFHLSRNIDLAAQDVRDRVAGVRGRLPEDIEEPVVAKEDADASPMMWIGMTSGRYSTLELTRLAENRIKNRLQTVRGVSRIRIGGEKRFAMRLWLDAEKMAAHQVTVLDVERALRQQNVELPSGRVEGLDRELTIETRGQMKTPQEFNLLVIRTEGTKIVRLRDLGEAREGVENERTLARNNGKPCIFVGVIKQAKANTIDVARDIREELNHLIPDLPEGVQMGINFDESVYIQKAIEEVWGSLGIAFILVVVVVFVFLRNLRSTLIPTAAIPVSIVATFALLHWLGYSINLLTMLAFVLAIGVVVDDAIVVLENITRHIEAGMPPKAAAFKAMEEIAFAIIAITISLVAVFVPLAFQRSVTGRMFVEFAAAVAGSVVVSAFVALSLSPMMASRILRPVVERPRSTVMRWAEAGIEGMREGYVRMLGWSLRHRLWIGLLGIGSAALTGWLFADLEEEFLPEEDKGRFVAMVLAPEGSTSEYTERMIRKIESILAETKEVDRYGVMVGFSQAGPGLANRGIAFVRLKEERDRNLREIVQGPGGLQQRFFNEIEGAMVIPIMPKAFGRSLDAALQLVVQSDDLSALGAYSEQLVNRLRKEGFLMGVQSQLKFEKPELRLHVDRNRCAALDVSIEDISRTLQILFGGLDLSRISLEGKEYDVMAQLQRSSRLTPQDLDRLYVRNAKGHLIQLNSLVTRQAGSAPNAILHFNRLRNTIITGTPIGMSLGTAMRRVEAIVKEDLPAGFRYDWAGESRDLRETGADVGWFAILALLIVYMVLASQFESLIHPFTIILAVPLAAFGACGLLWILNAASQSGWIRFLPGMNLNLFSNIGLLLLIGLVTKNSILLVEFANQQRAQGLAAAEAMRQAGLIRFRPIIMTAISTIAGILPIAVGFGAGAESRRPMGVAVLGGMFTGTVLTLLVVPVVYVAFADLAARFRKHVPSPAAAVPSTSPRHSHH